MRIAGLLTVPTSTSAALPKPFLSWKGAGLIAAGALGIALVAGSSSPARAGTEKLSPDFRQKAMQACTGDAVRFCPQTLLDEEQTAACMKPFRSQLSPGCRAVYDEGIRTQAAH